MKLNSRQKSIIKIITEFTPQNPGTVLMISNILKISQRTVLREMPTVEKWFSSNEIELVKKTGVGIYLRIEDANAVLALLEDVKMDNFFTKEERRCFILSELLYETLPLKSFYFTSFLKISDGTLGADLDYAQEFLETYRVKLVRKPGVGAYVEGDEPQIRRAILGLFYEYVPVELMLSLISKEEGGSVEKARIFDFLLPKNIAVVKEILINLEKELYVKFTDNAFIRLILYLLIVIRRNEYTDKMKIERERFFRISLLPEYALARQISGAIEEKLLIAMTQEETSHIAMQLMSVNIWIKENESIASDYQINVEELVLKMILSVEEQCDISLIDNKMLIEDLTRHMKPTLSRLSMQIRIQNSQLDMLKKNYKTMYEATANACEIIKNIMQVDEIPEAEIGFIAMHFCVASEKTKSLDKNIKVVIACPLGVGTSKMIAIKLKNEFKNIEILDVISVLEINVERLLEHNVDLIISTVDLKVDYQYIKVSPNLTDKDRAKLQDIVKGIKTKPPTKIVKVPSDDGYLYKNNILYLSQLGTEIVALLDSVTVFRSDEIATIDDIFRKAANMYASDEEKKSIIVRDLKTRENIASTYLSEYEMYFMHCKTLAVDNCKFGFVKILNDFSNNEGEKVLGAIIMLMPYEATPIQKEVIRTISEGLIEYKDFGVFGQNGLISKEIEKILGRLYKKAINEKIGERNEN